MKSMRTAVKKILFGVHFSILTLGMSTLGFAQSALFANSSKKVICVTKNFDGTQVLKGFGQGKNLKKAALEIEKGAIYEVIFNGIREGSSDCSTKPLVNTPNAREVYEKFFNDFFSGKYKKFSKKLGSPNKVGNSGGLITMSVQVDVPRLKQFLIKKDIIPK